MTLILLAGVGVGFLWGVKILLAGVFKHWFFRKAINFGPIRFTLAKSGIGRSIGAFGARVGKSANGRRYLYWRGPFGTYYRRYFRK